MSASVCSARCCRSGVTERLPTTVVAAADRIVATPDDLDDAQSAALPVAGGTALQALADEARLTAGQRVLITGAAGGVRHLPCGSQKHLGAHVVGVCSAGNVAFVRDLGADEVVDYARDDFTRRSDRFDVVFDAACASSFAAARPVLADTGCYINTGGNAAAVASTVASAVLARLTSRQRAIPLPEERPGDLAAVGRARTREQVARAHRTHDCAGGRRRCAARDGDGHGRGKIIVRL
jgi:NADPH:quinone reductase-like Zn-dependent oxidoreductase